MWRSTAGLDGAERISFFFVLEMNNENALFCLFVSFIF